MKEDKDILTIQKKSKRKKKTIQVKITYPDEKYPFGKRRTENVVLTMDRTLEENFDDHLRNTEVIKKINKEYYFYLKKDGVLTKLNKNKNFSRLGLQDNDKIIVSHQKLPIKSDINLPDEYIMTTKRNLVEEENPSKQEKHFTPKKHNINQMASSSEDINNKKLIIIFSLLIISFLIIIIPLIVITYRIITGGYGQHFESEKSQLIIDLKYPRNTLFKFNGEKIIEIITEGDNITNDNSSNVFFQKSEFFLVVRENHTENDENKKIVKEWYTGYIGFNNISLNNVTIYDKEIYKILNKDNLRRLGENDPESKDGKVSDICFVKLDFYQNGEIKQIFLPNEFNLTIFYFIEDIMKLLIPKISSHLYSESIEEEIQKLNISEDDNYNDDNDDNITDNITDNTVEQDSDDLDIFDDNIDNIDEELEIENFRNLVSNSSDSNSYNYSKHLLVNKYNITSDKLRI